MILNSPTISGSLTVTGNIITSGSITISGSIASASYATNAELLDGLDSTAFATTGAYSATSASLYATSASLSATSGSLSATSGSLSATSGSLSATSGSLSTASGSFDTRVTALEVTGSALSSSLLTVSGSGYATSGSLSTASGSFDSRVATIESKYATTGSNTFTSTQVVSGSILQSGSFTTTGTIIAQTINVQTVTSSVVYSSGSNVFGNDIGNSQTFTGSVLITGSLTIAGGSSATSYSGTTIYGSTAVCSPVGKFTTCLDLGGALSGTSATFSGTICGNGATFTTTGNTSLIIASGATGLSRAIFQGTVGNARGFIDYDNSTCGFIIRTNESTALTISNAGVACFASTVCAPSFIGGTMSGTTIYGSTAVCSPVGKFSTCIDACSGYFSGNINSLQNLVLTRASTSAGSNIEFRTSSTLNWYIGTRGLVNNNFYIVNEGLTANNLILDASTGAATFACSVTAGGKITVNGGGLLLDLNGGSDTSSRVTGNRGNGDNLHIANIEFYNSFSSRLVGEMRGITGSGGTQSNSGQLAFYTNDNGTYAERMRITSGGNVGIGTSTPVSTNLVSSTTIVKSYNGDSPTSTTAQTYYINQSNLYLFGRNAGLTMVGNTNEESVIAFGNPYAYYVGGIRYGMGSGPAAGDMVFQTCGVCERMRITSGGDILFGFGKYFQWAADTASAATRSWAIRNNETANGDFAIVSSSTNNNTLNTTRLVITSGGNVGIGINTPFNKMTINTGTGNNLDIFDTGTSYGIGMQAVNGNNTAYKTWDFYATKFNFLSGDLYFFNYAAGTLSVNSSNQVISSSDKNLKTDDGGIDNALSKVLRLNPRYFHWKEDSGIEDTNRQLGFYAQDVQEALGVEVASKSSNDKWGIYDRGIIAMLTKAIQELKAENDIFKTCLGIS